MIIISYVQIYKINSKQKLILKFKDKHDSKWTSKIF